MLLLVHGLVEEVFHAYMREHSLSRRHHIISPRSFPVALVVWLIVSGYADGGDDSEQPLELVPDAIEEVERCLDGHPDMRARFERVADLVAGFETPFGLELLSTVHWVVRHLGAGAPEAVVAATYAWNDRKRRFSPSQIRLALKVLQAKGWLGEA